MYRVFLYLINWLHFIFIVIITGSRKEVLDEAVVNLVIKDSQPFSVVEDVGFRELIHLLDPNYVLPTRKVCICIIIS